MVPSRLKGVQNSSDRSGSSTASAQRSTIRCALIGRAIAAVLRTIGAPGSVVLWRSVLCGGGDLPRPQRDNSARFAGLRANYRGFAGSAAPGQRLERARVGSASACIGRAGAADPRSIPGCRAPRGHIYLGGHRVGQPGALRRSAAFARSRTGPWNPHITARTPRCARCSSGSRGRGHASAPDRGRCCGQNPSRGDRDGARS